MDPSTTSTKGSRSPRSALKNHSKKSSAPRWVRIRSRSGASARRPGESGQRPKAISSTLGWVAAVNATESPSQLRPAFIHRTWINVCSALTAASVGMLQLSGTGLGLLAPPGRPSAHLRSAIFRVYSRYRALSTVRHYRLVGTCRIITKSLVALGYCDTTGEAERGDLPANASQECAHQGAAQPPRWRSAAASRTTRLPSPVRALTGKIVAAALTLRTWAM